VKTAKNSFVFYLWPYQWVNAPTANAVQRPARDFAKGQNPTPNGEAGHPCQRTGHRQGKLERKAAFTRTTPCGEMGLPMDKPIIPQSEQKKEVFTR